MATFGELLGLEVPGVGALLTALQSGQRDPLLTGLHVGLMRLVQADMEEAHASGLLQVRWGRGLGRFWGLQFSRSSFKQYCRRGLSQPLPPCQSQPPPPNR